MDHKNGEHEKIMYPNDLCLLAPIIVWCKLPIIHPWKRNTCQDVEVGDQSWKLEPRMQLECGNGGPIMELKG